MKKRDLTRVFLAGLAYDYCVGYSALDARRLGLSSFILRDACRAIDLKRFSRQDRGGLHQRRCLGDRMRGAFRVKRIRVKSQQSRCTHF